MLDGRTKSQSTKTSYNLALGADHAGYDLKEKIKDFLLEQGHKVEDIGVHNVTPVDYPDIAEKAALLVVKKKVDRGILFCGTGIGMAMAANKIAGIRACACNDLYSARFSRAHNNANILAIGARIVSLQLAKEIVDIWLKVDFEGNRHQRRLDKVAKLEKTYHCETL
jgi:ribose 5-phosphate isomerase B